MTGKLCDAERRLRHPDAEGVRLCHHALTRTWPRCDLVCCNGGREGRQLVWEPAVLEREAGEEHLEGDRNEEHWNEVDPLSDRAGRGPGHAGRRGLDCGHETGECLWGDRAARRRRKRLGGWRS